MLEIEVSEKYYVIDNGMRVSHSYCGARVDMDANHRLKIVAFDVMKRNITIPTIVENVVPAVRCWQDSFENICYFDEADGILYIKFISGDIVSLHPDGSVAWQVYPGNDVKVEANTIRDDKPQTTIELDTKTATLSPSSDQIERDYPREGPIEYVEIPRSRYEDLVVSETILREQNKPSSIGGKIEDRGDNAVKNILKRAQDSLQAKAEERISRPITVWSLQTDQDHLFIVEKNEHDSEIVRFDVSTLVFNDARLMVESRNRSIVALLESIIDE